ncbi:MAG: SusD/RagB family nutrient-binding outer membrane lipoprotein, partial [Phocaeicola sp.]
MINNIIKRTGLISVALVGLSACTGNFLDINTNPYEVGKDDMSTDGYNVGAAITAMCGTVVSTDVNTAQFTDCLLGGPMGGYY